MANLVKLPNGVNTFITQFGETVAMAPAIAWVATMVKEESGVEESIELYKIARKLVPTNASYALNLMHIHGIKCNYVDSIAVAKQFLKSNPTLTAGGVSAAKFHSVR